MEKVFKLSIACTLDMAYKSQPIINEIDETANIDIQDRIGNDVFIHDNFIIYEGLHDDEPLDYILDWCNVTVKHDIVNNEATIVNSPDDINDDDIGVVVEEIVSFLNPFTLNLITNIYKKNGYNVSLVDVTEEVLLEDSDFIEKFNITEYAIISYKESLSMDDFLTKISNFGIESLTDIDKRIMENMSK
jgi:hypothetical protein